MPLKSGGAVETEQMRGRMNIGMICSGKSPCPTGEQITNGGFETGDFTAWTITGGPTVESYGPHSGIYHCVFWSYGDSIKQNIQSQKGYVIPVVCIKSFKVWLYGSHCPHADADVIITYSDDSTTTIHFTDLDDSWHECNILPYLEATKSVKAIEIMRLYYSISADDVSLSC